MTVSERERVIEHMRRMDERLLHTEVVIPLFRNMDFKNVRYLHGPSEKGKDLVFNVNDGYGGLRLEVCQVKNSPFTGKASSKDNTFTVLRQLQMCRQYEVLNPSNNQKEKPQGVVLFTTYELPDRDTADAGIFLDELRAQSIKVLGPDTILDLVQEYLPGLYNETAFPGTAISARLSQYLDTHHESSAFGLTTARKLTSFFVNLSLTPVGSILHAIQRNGVEDVQNCFPRRFMEIPSQIYTNVASSQAVLPEPLNVPWLLPLIASKVERTEDEEDDNAGALNIPDKPPIVDSLAISDCYKSPREVVVSQPSLESFIKGVSNHLALKSPTEMANAIIALSQVEETLRHLCILGHAIEWDDVDDNETDAKMELEGLVDGAPFYEEYDETFASTTFSYEDITPETLAQIRTNLCIQGEAGSGKTTIARAIALSSIQNNERVVFFPCSQIRPGRRSLRNEILRFLNSLIGDNSVEKAKDYLASADLILIDGLDEAGAFGGEISTEIEKLTSPKQLTATVDAAFEPVIPDDMSSRLKARKTSEGKIKISLAGSLSHNEKARVLFLNENTAYKNAFNKLFSLRKESPRVVATMRISHRMRLPSDFVRVQLRPMSDKQLKSFFEKWLKHSSAKSDKVIAYLKENPRLNTVCRTPIVATIVASLHERGQPLPRSKTEVYQQRFDLLLGKWDEQKGVGERNKVLAKDKLRFLSHLGLALHRSKKRTFSEVAAERLWRDTIASAYPDLLFTDVQNELVHFNNILFYEGKKQLSLGHLSYQEYLAAHGIVLRQNVNLLERNVFDPWWKEVILFYVGITGDASRFLSRVSATIGIPDDVSFLKQLKAEGTFTRASTRQFLADLENYTDDIPGHSDDETESDSIA